jgi:hypothetical protein
MFIVLKKSLVPTEPGRGSLMGVDYAKLFFNEPLATNDGEAEHYDLPVL